VQRINRRNGEARKDPFFQHQTPATGILFRRLKNKVHRTVERSALAEIARRTQQNGGMPVVSTGVHRAWRG
jgi:hypothetical protein